MCEVEIGVKAAGELKGPTCPEEQIELGKTGRPWFGRERRQKGGAGIRAKERRNCGGGSSPWKGRGEGEASTEREHFRELVAGASLPEALLPRRVPELQLDPLARLNLQQAREEVDANRGVAGGGVQPWEAALGEAVQEARLAHRGVPDHDEAELVDPDSLHRFCAPRAQGQVLPRELSLQHLCGARPAASSIFLRLRPPPSGEGGAGPRARGGDLSCPRRGLSIGAGPQIRAAPQVGVRS